MKKKNTQSRTYVLLPRATESGRSRLANAAFTLIELLVVIAIIVVLAGVLMSAVSKAKVSANRAQSIANVRSATTVALLYASDHNGQLPDENTTSDSTTEYSNLGTIYISSELIDPYMDWKEEAWFDPFISEKYNRYDYAIDSANWLWRGRIVYNQALTGGWETYASQRGLPIRVYSIVNPNNAFLFANLDAAGRGGYPDGKATVGFADGSVRLIDDVSYVDDGNPYTTETSVISEYGSPENFGDSLVLKGFDF
jgi:prepilin-type N-terminal cleavage/methylation domain-containing protein/prepilin-type processing-associated H-X9-DG protein